MCRHQLGTDTGLMLHDVLRWPRCAWDSSGISPACPQALLLSLLTCISFSSSGGAAVIVALIVQHCTRTWHFSPNLAVLWSYESGHVGSCCGNQSIAYFMLTAVSVLRAPCCVPAVVICVPMPTTACCVLTVACCVLCAVVDPAGLKLNWRRL